MTGQHLRGLPVFLRAPRGAALWLIGAGITVASVVAYVLSYAGLAQWALHHGWAPAGAIWFPFLIDLPLVVCEVILFVAAIDGDTPQRVRALAWAVLLAFTTASTVGNADHLAAATPLTRGGFALPPVVLAVALGFGLGELKRQAAKYREPSSSTVPGTVPSDVAEAAKARLRFALAHGFRLSNNELCDSFPLTRAQVTRVREEVLAENNGHGGT